MNQSDPIGFEKVYLPIYIYMNGCIFLMVNVYTIHQTSYGILLYFFVGCFVVIFVEVDSCFFVSILSL